MKEVKILRENQNWELAHAINQFISEPDRHTMDIQFRIVPGYNGYPATYAAMIVYEDRVSE